MTTRSDQHTPWRPRRLLVADQLLGRELARDLAALLPECEVRQRALTEVQADDLTWAEVFIGFHPPGDLPLDGLRWVHSTGAGVDAYLFRRPFPETVLLTRTLGEFGSRIAEYCVAHALADCQRLRALARAQQERRWEKIAPRELRGSRVLIAGTGAIGRAVAAAFAALGCQLVGCSESGRAVAPFATVAGRAELPRLVSEADFIVITVPLTESTHHMFDAAVLSSCRGAHLINVARGRVVDEAALVQALEQRRLRAAVLDVFATEPLPADSPLWGRADLVVSPHIAALTKLEEARETLLANYEDLAQGRAPRTRVDVRRGY